MSADLRSLTGDPRQFASVRRIILGDGPEAGVEALAFSTGGGLDFWALAGRALDIGPLWWRGMPVAWQSPAGFRNAGLTDPEADGGRGFERAFSGLHLTCGLDQTRQPAEGRPLHGRLPFLPARLMAHGESWDAPEPLLFCEGETRQFRYGHENLVLRRRIEAPIGGTTLRIRDIVRNDGSAVQRHALLYHFNFGWPFVVPGSRLTTPDGSHDLTIGPPDPGATRNSVCRPAAGEAALIRPDGAALRLRFGRGTLPFLQVWRDPRPGAYVLALEPCTDAKAEDGTSLAPVMLEPGETRAMEIELAFEAPT